MERILQLYEYLNSPGPYLTGIGSMFGQTLTKVNEVKFSFFQGHLGRASLEHRPALLDLCGQQHRAHQGEHHLGGGGHDCGGGGVHNGDGGNN